MRERMPIELIALSEDKPESHADVSLAVGTVTGCHSSHLTITMSGAEVDAQRALSCLIAPEVGDVVLAASSTGRHFILSVLERHELQRVELSVPAAGATLSLAAGEIELSGATRISQTAPDIRLEANAIGLFGRSVSLVGNLLTYLADRLHSSVSQQTIVADHVATKARNRVTVVDGTDIQKIGVLSQSIHNTATISADSAIMTARKDMRIDAERISMG